MAAIMDQLKALPISERLKIVGDLWDSIDEDAIGPTFTAEQLEEFNRRSLEMDADPSSAISWDEAKRRLRGQSV